MPNWFTAWFGYGLGARTASTIFAENRPDHGEAAQRPIQAQTEEEIRADYTRSDEDEKRLDAADAAAKRARDGR
jgi:hypothetical protein